MDGILSLDEFEAMSKNEQKELLENLKEEMGTTALIKHWGISRTKMYNMIHQLGIPVHNKRGKSSIGSPPSFFAGTTNKFIIAINEDTQGKIISDKLVKLAKLLEDDESTYSIRLDLREV